MTKWHQLVMSSLTVTYICKSTLYDDDVTARFGCLPQDTIFINWLQCMYHLRWRVHYRRPRAPPDSTQAPPKVRLNLIFSRPEGPCLLFRRSLKNKYEGLKSGWKFWYARKCPTDRPTVRPSDHPTVRPSDRPTVRDAYRSQKIHKKFEKIPACIFGDISK